MAASGLLLKPTQLDFSPLVAFRHELESVMSEEKPLKILLVVVGADGPSIPLELWRFNTVASVRIQIQSRKGFYVEQQSLVYGVRELPQNECPIKDYGVSNDELLHLVLRVSDLLDITVNNVNGNKHVFKAQSENDRYLKKNISKRQLVLPLEEQSLIPRVQDVEGGTVIEDLPVGGDVVLHLTVPKAAKIRTRNAGKHLELVFVASDLDALTLSTEGFHAEVTGDTGISTVEEVVDIQRPSSVLPRAKKKGVRSPEVKIGQELVGHHSSLEPARHSLRYEIPEILKDLLVQVRTALQAGHTPILSSEGSGGVYFMKNESGLEYVAVFKPVDEEPMAVNNPRGFSSCHSGEGLKRGTRIGEGAIREVAAYLLDRPCCGPKYWCGKMQEGFAGVPPTMLVRCYHGAFHSNLEEQKLYRKAKVGSLQQFIHAVSSCEDMGPSDFPVEEVHKISVLDLRLANADRNGGNILVCKGENSLKLVPIDHGYCLPEKFEDCTFEWLYWPQSRHSYGYFTLKYIASLDAEEDIALLRQFGWNLRAQTAQVLRVSTMLLKKGAAAGLTPFQIGSIMSREFPDSKSSLEILLEQAEARKQLAESKACFLEVLSELLDSYIATMKSV
eukprot:c19066_g1_i1 orf=458-2305(+)